MTEEQFLSEYRDGTFLLFSGFLFSLLSYRVYRAMKRNVIVTKVTMWLANNYCNEMRDSDSEAIPLFPSQVQ